MNTEAWRGFRQRIRERGRDCLKTSKKNFYKSAVVTGASSGIGLAVSRVLCEIGYEVYGFGREFPGEESKHFHPEILDLLETGRLCDRIKEIAKDTRVEVLVNAAGVGYYGLHEELSVKQIQTLVRTNLEVPLILTNRLLRNLKENHGTIINISSVTAKQSSPHGCAYGATKAGLSAFGQSLFDEARKYGVRVTTIHPDMTQTDLYRNADFTCGEEPESYLLPEEVAETVRYVLSQRDGVVVPDITIRPQLHRIMRKKN
jgi:short-subunit dehydrogenase